LLGVLPRFAGQVHGGKAEGLRGVTDDGLQGGIRRSCTSYDPDGDFASSR
jgi:hypothetical protein